MSGIRVINFKSSSGMSSDYVKKEDLFDSDGKIKDNLIDASISVGVTMTYTCTNASDTPKGKVWTKNGSVITGTLEASQNTLEYFYLTYDEEGGFYRKYATVQNGSTYEWQFFGYSGSGGPNNLTYVHIS